MNTLELKEGQTYICTKSDKPWWTVGKEYKVFLYSDSELAIKDDYGVDWHSSYSSYLDTFNIQFKLKEEQPKVTLDEPQKVKVPAYVAKWIELCKEKADVSSCLNGYYEIGNGTIVRPRGFSDEFYDWLADCGHMDDLARAWLDGYEVEEEPKWKIINDQKYCLTSIEAGYGNSLHWAFDSTKKKPILFDNEETALYTAYITGGAVEKVEE